MSVHSEIAYEITDVLRRELTGRDCGDLLHYANAERVFPVGCIFPEPEEGETTKRPTSCGFSVKTSDNGNTDASVELTGHFYVRRQPTLHEQMEHLSRHWNANMDEVRQKLATGRSIPLAHCWKYVPFRIVVDVKRGCPAKREDLTEALAQAWISARDRARPVPCRTEGWRTKLTEAPGRDWQTENEFEEWIRDNFKDNGSTPDKKPTHVLTVETEWNRGTLSAAVINQSKSNLSKEKKDWLLDQGIYSIEFEIADAKRIGVQSITKIVKDTFDAAKATTFWGEGRNLHVMFEDGRIRASPIAISASNRTMPIDDVKGVDLSFEGLSSNPVHPAEIVIEYLKGMTKEYEKLESVCDPRQYKNAVNKILSVTLRMESGLELLKSDKHMREAFGMMNETFSRRYVCDTRLRSWRLFQFAYIVGKLPGIVNPDEDTCDVIYVTTGGGKTEAYFGLLITTMFYQRLKSHYAGTIAVVKFPFRMLAIDQIQRIAPLIAMADMVRSEHPSIGAVNDLPRWMYEFSLGFMIGESSSRATPNRVNADKQREDREDIPSEKTDLRTILFQHPDEVKLFFECPVCRYNNHIRGHSCAELIDTVDVSYDDEGIRGKHECSVCGSRFAVHWTDEECFRFLPTVVISTQDRIAYPAFAPHARAIFGAPLFYCPNHGFSIYSNSCTAFKGPGGYGKKSGKCSYLSKNHQLKPLEIEPEHRGLRFVIQDEMHLLRSDLGALNSPFERMVSHTVKHYCGSGPQYIGMSATVQGVDTQVKELYGSTKRLWLFPGDPPIPIDGSEQEPDAFFTHSNELHRLILGCMPSMGDPSVVVQRTADIITSNVDLWEDKARSGSLVELPNRLRAIEPATLSEGLRQYRVILGFMNTKVDLERSQQNIVNLTNVERRKTEKMGAPSERELEVGELTGNDTITDIMKAMARIRSSSEVNPRERIDVLFATNLVSHGIDLPSMNLMIFYGLPGSTSEYVQALSRVGRRNPGIVLLAYHPNHARDRGLWRTFGQYHQALRQQVEVMPVDHCAPGLLDQTFVTLLRCYWNLRSEVDMNLASTHSQKLYTVKQIVEANETKTQMITSEACGTILKWYEWDSTELVRLSSKANAYLTALRTYYHEVRGRKYPANLPALAPPPLYNDLRRLLQDQAEPWMTTMKGIRGIQEGLSQGCDRFSDVYLRMEMES